MEFTIFLRDCILISYVVIGIVDLGRDILFAIFRFILMECLPFKIKFFNMRLYMSNKIFN